MNSIHCRKVKVQNCIHKKKKSPINPYAEITSLGYIWVCNFIIIIVSVYVTLTHTHIHIYIHVHTRTHTDIYIKSLSQIFILSVFLVLCFFSFSAISCVLAFGFVLL